MPQLWPGEMGVAVCGCYKGGDKGPVTAVGGGAGCGFCGCGPKVERWGHEEQNGEGRTE